MNAIQPSRFSPHDFKPPTEKLRRRRHQAVRRAHPHHALMWEVGSKLMVSVSLVIFAGLGLARLVPETLAQQEQLEVLSNDVTALQTRVDGLQSGFGDRFDPQQAQRIMQENTNQVVPGQVRVIWREQNSRYATSGAAAPAHTP